MPICFMNCFITAAHSNMGCWIDLDISLDLSKSIKFVFPKTLVVFPAVFLNHFVASIMKFCNGPKFVWNKKAQSSLLFIINLLIQVNFKPNIKLLMWTIFKHLLDMFDSNVECLILSGPFFHINLLIVVLFWVNLKICLILFWWRGNQEQQQY